MRRVACLLAVAPIFLLNISCHSEKAVDIIDRAFIPSAIEAEPAGTISWTNKGDENHTTTSNQLFWDSGTMVPGATFGREFVNAGRFGYRCTFHPNKMEGKVEVPVAASAPSAVQGTDITIFWAFCDSTCPPAIPAGFDADIQVREPGSKRYKTWLEDQTGSQTQAAYTLEERGRHRFRARFQNTATGEASGYSPSVRVVATQP